jgi:glycosyltransferase involved in cell wall biosynthesis
MAYYFDTLNQLKLDLMLIPREDNYFNRCKSNLKFLEAAMCEIPVIAQGMTNGPYQELNGENGIRVDNDNDWEKLIWDLVENKDKRRLIGANAKQYVLQNYSIENHAHEWVNAFQNLYAEKNFNPGR